MFLDRGLVLNFERQEQNGKFRVRGKFTTEPAQFHINSGGILHSLNDFFLNDVRGDVPSLGRSIDSMKSGVPKFIVKSGYTAAVNVGALAWDGALLGENIAVNVGHGVSIYAEMNMLNKIRSEANQSGGDMTKSAEIALSLANDEKYAVNSYLRKKRQFKLEKRQYKLLLKDKKNFKIRYKQDREKYKADLKSARTSLKLLKRTDESKKQFELNRKKAVLKVLTSKSKMSDLKLEKKDFKTRTVLQRNRIKNSRSNLFTESINSVKMTAYFEADAKLRSADENNDFIRAGSSAMQFFYKTRYFRRRSSGQKSLSKLIDKKNKKAAARRFSLAKLEGKLNKRQHKLMIMKKAKKKAASKQTAKTAVKGGEKAVKVSAKAAQFAIHALFKVIAVIIANLPVILIAALLIFIIVIIFLVITSLITGGGAAYIAGTYTAYDTDLTEASDYYSEIAYNFNENIRKCGTNDWKNGLSGLGADTSSMSDVESLNNCVWGKSDLLDYDSAGYDYDCYKLWSFLSAYYWDFDYEDDGWNFWEFDSDTEDVIRELFYKEYSFEYVYIDESDWRELDSYIYYGGGSGGSSDSAYFTCDNTATIYSGQSYKYSFYSDNLGYLSRYSDNNTLYIDSDLRVLDANNDFGETGYVLYDHRYYAGESVPFYSYNDSDGDGIQDDEEFFFVKDNTTYYRSFLGWEDGSQAWFIVPNADAVIYNENVGGSGLFGYYQKYEWVSAGTLYYNVRQKMTFEDAIEMILKEQTDGNDRYELYQYMINCGCSGNHQLLSWITTDAGVTDSYLLHGHGYDVVAWNSTHCDTDYHEGIDFVSGYEYYDEIFGRTVYGMSPLTTPIDCTIESYDEESEILVLIAEDVSFWYENNEKHDIRITLENVNLSDIYEAGDTLEKGETFGRINGNRNCGGESIMTGIDAYIHIKVEMKVHVLSETGAIIFGGIGGYAAYETIEDWKYIDPRLLFG